MPSLFGLTLFVAAALLFVVEPMVARMILPKFGGTPAVWTTCMLFFQAALLAGYGYAHVLTTRLGLRRQTGLHALVLLAGLAALPLITVPITGARDWIPPPDVNPVLPLLGLLAAAVGVPFLVVSTTAPLLQRWYASTSHHGAHDPYFLYAASNAGSLIGLLAYPFLIAPALGLGAHGPWWAAGYVLLAVLVAACALAVRKDADARMPVIAKHPPALADSPAPVGAARRLRWVLLAFVPSSLLLGVTTHLTTDIAPIPLLWVVPLALYLGTFILAFSRLPGWVQRVTAALVPAVLLLLLILLEIGDQGFSLRVAMALHLGAFFIIALYCHGALAEDRPASGSLTEYYLWISTGGVLGGLFNAVLAPLVFRSLVEYPLVAALACLFNPPRAGAGRGVGGRLVLPVALGVAAGSLVALARWYAWPSWLIRVRIENLLLALWLLNLVITRQPIRFGLGVGMVMAGVAVFSAGHDHPGETVLYRGRSFFGTYSVAAGDRIMTLYHGRIVHGQQRVGPDQRPVAHPKPLSYYYPTGPIGQVFGLLAERSKTPVGVVGLGAGALAAYGQQGQEFAFYEIDPAIERIARDERFFTFLRDCKADWRVVLGDGRLSLVQAPDGHYGLIVLDAFTSDAVPVHLLTREAIELYLRKLAPGGLIAFNLSNHYLDLTQVMGALAWDLELASWVQEDNPPIPGRLPELDAQYQEGKAASTWLVLARRPSDFGRLADDRRWHRLQFRPSVSAWTDNYSNLLDALRQR